jgi:hypothetical protein
MTPPVIRTLSLAGFGALLLLAILAVFGAASGWMSSGDALADARERAARPVPRIDADRYLIAGAGRTNAESALQGRISAHARPTGVDINRVRIIPEDQNDASLVVADIDATGRWAELTRFIHLLESEPPALVIREVRLISERARPGVDIDMTLTIEARFLPETREAAQ